MKFLHGFPLLISQSFKNKEIIIENKCYLFGYNVANDSCIQKVSLKFLTPPEESQICSSCRSQLIDTTGISSSFNSGNIAEPSFRHSDFSDTKMQCKNKYQKVGVEVLDQIIEESNASRDVQEKFQLPRLHQNLGDAENL